MDDCFRTTDTKLLQPTTVERSSVSSGFQSEHGKDLIAYLRKLFKEFGANPVKHTSNHAEKGRSSLAPAISSEESAQLCASKVTTSATSGIDRVQVTITSSACSYSSKFPMTTRCQQPASPRRLPKFGDSTELQPSSSDESLSMSSKRSIKSNAMVASKQDSMIPTRRSRLPWLDGNKSRQSTRPDTSSIPGAFVDDIPGPKESETKIPLGRKQNGAPIRPSPQSKKVQVQSDSTVDSQDSLAMLDSSQVRTPDEIPLHQPRPLSKPVPQESHCLPHPRGAHHHAPDLSEESQPAVPLAAIARELRQSLLNSSVTPPPDRLPLPAAEDSPQTPSPLSGGPVRPGVSSSDRSKNPMPSTQNLQQSISSLEKLIDEATKLAQNAARDRRSDELPRILSDAAQAINEASSVRDNQRKAMDVPLADEGGAVPYEYDSISSDEDDSTFSVASSVSPPRPRPIKRSVGRPVERMPAAPHQQPLQAQSNTTDFAYSNSRQPENYLPSIGLPGSEPIRKRGARSGTPLPSSPLRVQMHSIAGGHEPTVPTRRSSLPKETFGEGAPVNPAGNTGPTERGYGSPPTGKTGQTTGQNWGRDKFNERDYLSADDLKGKRHITLGDNQKWSIHHHRRQPIARNWSTRRKRFTAAVTCLNTAVIGMLVGIYAGEVPAIQYALNDMHHHVILGNVMLYLGMAITVFFFWPLPLLHGRKPYTLIALAVVLPLQFPQAIIVMTKRTSSEPGWIAGLLICRAVTGLALGFAHINFKATLLDLFGASLQSTHPHGEIVIMDDVRRHGGGIGMWLGIWSFSFIGSLAFGFLVGALIVTGSNLSWGFYINVILIVLVLLLNVITPETRRAPHRRTMQEVELPNLSITRRVARGEIKMHVQGDGPKWWWEECSAAVYLSLRMLDQPGFGLMALYLGWVYGQIALIIVLLGNLLSTSYYWRPSYVGLGVFSIAVGALLAVPNTKANFFSKSRSHPARTDSMTFEPRVTWTSHMVRRGIFMIVLPLAGIAYTVASAGTTRHFMAPIVMAGIIGYISNLAIAECHGLIMETFDTSDLQPGVNSKHRLQSLPSATKRRRTAYSSYPRVSAGFFVSQTLGFLFAAAATGIGGAITRRIGAEKATGITAGILLALTILLTLALWRYKSVQVIPNSLFGGIDFKAGKSRNDPGPVDANKANNAGTVARGDTAASSGRDGGGQIEYDNERGNEKQEEVDDDDDAKSVESDKSWRAVIVGNPSGKIRRMNLLELGGLSRWTEIRRLNRLLGRTGTQALNEGWQ